MITGAQAMVKCLQAEQVSLVFGYPGAAICPFYDSLVDSSIRHILTRTEQNAGHAASGYARVTGTPGVCVATSGPGATNLFTAIATAYMDSIPLIAITGQVPTDLLGRDVFQEVDTTGSVEPFTKYSYLVKNAQDIPRVFKEAFYLASTGRKGPVLIDMPVDIQRQMIEYHEPKQLQIRGYKPRTKGHPVQIQRVAQAIRSAKRPLLCVGGGVISSGAQSAVQKLCEQSSLPVVSTMMALGVMPTAHPLYFGMLGQSGSVLANEAVEQSDLLILIGARVGDRAVASPKLLESNTTIVHIDIDSAEIGKNLGTTIPLVGDAGNVVEQLLKQDTAGDWGSWLKRMQKQREKSKSAQTPRKTGQINPNLFIQELSNRMDEDAIYVADVGENQIWSAKNMQMKHGQFLTTGGMGTMGYALPAAIGAKLAAPQKQVVTVCGDGGFQMAMMELATAKQHNVPVKLVIMQNGMLGLVREIQQNQYAGREMAVSLDGSPDFCKLAQAFGIPSMQIDRMEEVPLALDALLKKDQPFVLVCTIDSREGTK